MQDISKIEELFGASFKVLNGLPEYITIEQNMLEPNGAVNWEDKIRSFIQLSQEWKLARLGVLLHKASAHYNHLSTVLVHYGFEHFSSKVEFIRDLKDINESANTFHWRSLENPQLTEEEYKKLWSRCMLYSDNAPSSLTIEQHLDAVKTELGETWRKSCIVFYINEKPVGISIPHIEPGTTDEGRIFYFGVLPEERGKGISSLLHLQSLFILKEMGANYYVGSTHLQNEKMQKVFQKNGCIVHSNTESYYKYL